MNNFNSIYIIRKLDDQYNQKVEIVVKKIELFAKNYYKKICEKSEIGVGTLIIAVGGDGTMLEAMQIAYSCETVAIGINLGKVGFLTDIANDETLSDEAEKKRQENYWNKLWP